MSETIETPVVETPSASADAGDDLRAAIGAAWDEAESATGTETSETPADRNRDDAGRFVGSAETAEGVPPALEAEAPEEPVTPAVEPPAPSPITAVLDEYKPLYAARGIPAEQAVKSLFEAQQILETRPVEAIQVLARQYGVDLTQFAPRPAAGTATKRPRHGCAVSEGAAARGGSNPAATAGHRRRECPRKRDNLRVCRRS